MRPFCNGLLFKLLSARTVGQCVGQTQLNNAVACSTVPMGYVEVFDVRDAEIVTEIDTDLAHRDLVADAENPGKIGGK